MAVQMTRKRTCRVKVHTDYHLNFFDAEGKRLLEPHPLNQRAQASTLQKYVTSIRETGTP
jgi:hypothetical protein